MFKMNPDVLIGKGEITWNQAGNRGLGWMWNVIFFSSDIQVIFFSSEMRLGALFGLNIAPNSLALFLGQGKKV